MHNTPQECYHPPGPLMTVKEHVQHVEQSRNLNPEPPFSQTYFFIFDTSQNKQPFQGRRISRMSTTTVGEWVGPVLFTSQVPQ